MPGVTEMGRIRLAPSAPRRFIEKVGNGPHTAVVIIEPWDGECAPVLLARFAAPPRLGTRFSYRDRSWVLARTPDDNGSFWAEPLPDA